MLPASSRRLMAARKPASKAGAGGSNVQKNRRGSSPSKLGVPEGGGPPGHSQAWPCSSPQPARAMTSRPWMTAMRRPPSSPRKMRARAKARVKVPTPASPVSWPATKTPTAPTAAFAAWRPTPARSSRSGAVYSPLAAEEDGPTMIGRKPQKRTWRRRLGVPGFAATSVLACLRSAGPSAVAPPPFGLARRNPGTTDARVTPRGVRPWKCPRRFRRGTRRGL